MATIDVSSWSFFRLDYLFEIKKGTRLTKANMTPGAIRYVGSSALNNGQTALIANDEAIHPENTITVCYNGSVGETFYQDTKFWASDDVNVCYPRFKMNKPIGLFLAPLIKKAALDHCYTDKWKLDDMLASEIPLPTNEEGKPDWKFIEEYSRSVMEKAKHTVSAFSSIPISELKD